MLSFKTAPDLKLQLYFIAVTYVVYIIMQIVLQEHITLHVHVVNVLDILRFNNIRQCKCMKLYILFYLLFVQLCR